jgi:hypothetical protein
VLRTGETYDVRASGPITNSELNDKAWSESDQHLEERLHDAIRLDAARKRDARASQASGSKSVMTIWWDF